ncbi:Os01g0853900 [Oryza sativa Japonica Group]|uniref:Os01g0853900 protein n=1 Tax=Oryza sativa subsp. japonica TaxID=39947 RepID=A0A0P0VAG2_ORYSJ|nr:Os01g0853900 [Oryza sativa Japonica Group]
MHGSKRSYYTNTVVAAQPASRVPTRRSSGERTRRRSIISQVDRRFGWLRLGHDAVLVTVRPERSGVHSRCMSGDHWVRHWASSPSMQRDWPS